MGNVVYFPPRIEHQNLLLEGEERMQLLSLAIRKLRLPSAARRLMMYYAAQAQNFRPSLVRIENETGIKSNHISEVRAILIKYGLIEYSDKAIVIDWYIIYLLSALDEKKMGAKKNWQIMPDRKTAAFDQQKLEEREKRKAYHSSAEKQWMNLYEATREAVKDGVIFPELKDNNDVQVLPVYAAVDPAFNDDEDFVAGCVIPEEKRWYDPFKDPDPPWVMQEPLKSAVGSNVIYVHFNNKLPF